MRAWKCDQKRASCPQCGCVILAETRRVSCPSAKWSEIELWNESDSNWEPRANLRVYSNVNPIQPHGISNSIQDELDYREGTDVYHNQFTVFIIKDLQPKYLDQWRRLRYLLRCIRVKRELMKQRTTVQLLADIRENLSEYCNIKDWLEERDT